MNCRTPTDAELEEFLHLQKAVKPMLKRIEEIRSLCKERGSFFTANYVCSVKLQERRGMAGLDECIDALGQELLDKHELIRLSSFLLVYVARLNDQITID